MDNLTLFKFIIKHGPYHVSVHPCRVSLKNISQENIVIGKDKPNEHSKKEDSDSQQQNRETEYKRSETKEKVVTIPWPVSKASKTDDVQNSDSESEEEAITDTQSEMRMSEDQPEDRPSQLHAKKDLNTGTVVSVNVEGLPDKWRTVELKSRAGKATGKYKDAWNVRECDSGKEYYVDLNRVQWSHDYQAENNEKANDSETPEECLVSSDVAKLHKEAVASAKMKELSGWKENNVYQEVDDVGQERISVRWVVTEKIKNSEVITKARLCA